MRISTTFLLFACISVNALALDQKFYGKYQKIGSYMSVWIYIDEKLYIYKIESDVKRASELPQANQFSGEYVEKNSCLYLPTSSTRKMTNSITAYNYFRIYCPKMINNEPVLVRKDGYTLNKINESSGK